MPFTNPVASVLPNDLFNTHLASETTVETQKTHLTMSSSWSERYKQVIKTCLESEETFRTYLTKSPNNVRQAYLAFRGLVRLFSESVNDREELEKKVNNVEHAKSRMEGALTYVENQLNTL